MPTDVQSPEERLSCASSDAHLNVSERKLPENYKL